MTKNPGIQQLESDHQRGFIVQSLFVQRLLPDCDDDLVDDFVDDLVDDSSEAEDLCEHAECGRRAALDVGLNLSTGWTFESTMLFLDSLSF